ncbi:MAG: MauE/DoxX family redox-associated membrane protein, partial [Planctomycetota bacterium]
MHRPALPGFALSAGMLWLLAGALYKLFDGSPNDLPEVVKEMSPLSGWETMRAAIIVELAVVGLVIAKPRLGWLLLCGVFATFLAILFPLVQAGESSCGCFGSNVTIAPEVMMGIDGGLLLLILISRPWRLPKESGLGWSAYVPLLAAAIAGPWMKLEAPQLPGVRKPALETEVGAPKPGTDPKLTSGFVDAVDGATEDAS